MDNLDVRMIRAIRQKDLGSLDNVGIGKERGVMGHKVHKYQGPRAVKGSRWSL
jgi:hypothetical protein